MLKYLAIPIRIINVLVPAEMNKITDAGHHGKRCCNSVLHSVATVNSNSNKILVY